MRATVKKNWTAEEDRRIREMRSDHSVVEIANALGLSSAQIAYRIRQLGISPRPKDLVVAQMMEKRQNKLFSLEYPFLREGHVATDQLSFEIWSRLLSSESPR